MKKYFSLIGFSLLILIVCFLGYQAFYAYLGQHTYYIQILSSAQNWRILVTAIIFGLIPIIYLLSCQEAKLKVLIPMLGICAGVFGAIHSFIKLGQGQGMGIFGYLMVIFHTILLFSLGIYLICGFSAIGSRIERKIIRFKQMRRQEIFLCFGLGLLGFLIIIQILLGIDLLYGIISWILFVGLGFMIRYERKNLSSRVEKIETILNNFKNKLNYVERNLNSKNFWTGGTLGNIALLILILISLGYIYISIQNSFVPYSTAWDANHEYMYTPKILAENAGIYRGNTVGNNMPGIWHLFLTFIFSLTGCTNGRLGLSPDNVAISMNNLSSIFVLIFGIAIIFQIFTLANNSKTSEKKEDKEISKLKKGKNSTTINVENIENSKGITTGRFMLLLRLTSGMGAFLVIVDNKTDLGVMALGLLALLAGLIFIQNQKTNNDKKDLLNYLIITGVIFGFAALAKITAFVDLVLFGLLLVGLRFSPICTLGLGVTVMGLSRKFNILTSSVMITDANATRLILIGIIITVLGLIITLLKSGKRKLVGNNFVNLVLLGISFLLPFIIFKLPWTIISSIKTDNFSMSNSLKSTFLGINLEKENKISNYKKLLSQNSGISPSFYDSIDSEDLDSYVTDQKSFSECTKIGNIYSEEELNENLEEIVGGQGGEDFGRYIGYGRKEFKKLDIMKYNASGTGDKNVFNFLKALRPKMTGDALVDNLTEDQAIYLMQMGLKSTFGGDGSDDEEDIIFESNLSYGLLKLIWPTSQTCYGFNHDAKVLCNNASVIDNFEINNIQAIYENGIKDKEGEAGLLLKEAIVAYNKAKAEGKIKFGTSLTSLFHDEIVNLRQYYQSHSISSNEGSIHIPYRYLVPLNISFNRSLQNLSSYYTDIGFIRIIVYILLIVSLPYAIIKKDNLLTNISLTTIIGRGIWWIIGSAILWYGTVLISRSIITLALFIDKLLNNKNLRIIPWAFSIVIGIFFSIQLIFNFMRINSQGANSIFVRYKGNEGKQQIIKVANKNLEINERNKYGYAKKNIFDLQFAHYNPIINGLANRKNEDGVIVAGTYIQYFLGNHWNVKADGMLSNFWKITSDGDLCKTYRRLKNDNTHYLLIDPNIGTVTMGEGNETLFYRFFGKLNGNKTEIEIDGTITTLIKLAKNGYLKLMNTNNIGAKYAFTIDDNTIRSYLGGNISDNELILIRAKMAVLQYFSNEGSILSAINNILSSRIVNDTKSGIEDIANIYGLEINSENVANVASKHINGGFAPREGWNDGDLDGLTQNERNILINYLDIYRTYQKDPTNFGYVTQNILYNNLFYNGSQIIALELN